ncbi:hypothetical protein TEA_028074 [Camellia sinensis var. sinensis]|uniref:eRF1/Pelota-like N-terminal domain-containing protein n=1 Tax=Camellia sinensis var. sinensis TaxID=542762 RepID=A0A4S4EWA4_CAMSN|nr:hypothetical protein TEA_028074 [Camellia sinensis var. sinensis]
MKIVRRDYIPDGPGSVKMVPEEADDLWLAYNLIATGDTVLAVTVRKVLRQAASGGRDAERVKLKLEIKVEAVDYDKEGSVLRIRGRNILENEHVKIGAFHTLEIELHRPFVLRKALNKFFDNVLTAFLKHIDFNVVRCAVIASPGFTRDQFHRHLLLEAERKQLRPIIENKSRIILVHTTSGYKHSLREVLDAPNVMNIIKDTKAAEEVRALKEFFNMLSNVRSCDIATRQKYVNLVKSVKDSGGTALIFSSMHVSGEQLAQLTGIAAILRFPLPDLEDIEM